MAAAVGQTLGRILYDAGLRLTWTQREHAVAVWYVRKSSPEDPKVVQVKLEDDRFQSVISTCAVGLAVSLVVLLLERRLSIIEIFKEMCKLTITFGICVHKLMCRTYEMIVSIKYGIRCSLQIFLPHAELTQNLSLLLTSFGKIKQKTIMYRQN